MNGTDNPRKGTETAFGVESSGSRRAACTFIEPSRSTLTKQLVHAHQQLNTRFLIPTPMPRPAFELAHCIVCGHADANVVAGTDDLRREVEWLWEYQSRRLKPGTPIARLIDRVAFSQDPPFRLVQCRECGLVYRNPVERPHELKSVYGDEGPTRETLVALYKTQRAAYHAQARRLREVLGRGGSVLEVGSYVGAFLDAARDEGLSAEGVDINATTNDFTRSLGFTVRDGELRDISCDRSFDAVVIWNTLDQLADPRGTVIGAAQRLNPSGVVRRSRAERRMLCRVARPPRFDQSRDARSGPRGAGAEQSAHFSLSLGIYRRVDHAIAARRRPRRRAGVWGRARPNRGRMDAPVGSRGRASCQGGAAACRRAQP